MTDYYGLPTRVIANSCLSLEVLAEAGPRIVRLKLNGSDENLLAETPDFKWATPYGDYYLRGGHRLWRAPEMERYTYVPDNAGVTIEELAEGARLCGPLEIDSGLRKSIEVRLHSDRAAATLTHQLRNEGTASIEVAAWAITQLPLGGLALLPGRATQAVDFKHSPDRHLVLWPHTHWQDPRLRLGDEYILVESRTEAAALKVGSWIDRGRIAYWRAGMLLVKHFTPQRDRAYPDRGCNVEVYCDDHFIELETLGPLCCLEPGQTIEHTEVWELHQNIPTPQAPQDLPAILGELGL